MTRVLIVDDDPLVRRHLATILSAQGVDVLGAVTDGDEVPDAVAAHRPDVLLIDLQMRRVGGIDAIRELRRHPDPPAVLVLTAFGSDETVRTAIAAGAAGFVSKTAGPQDLLRHVRAVAAGGGGLDPTAQRAVLDSHAVSDRASASQADAARQLAALTARERDVVSWLPHGLTNAEIAACLYMSASTVKQHLSSATARLGLTKREQLAVLVDRAGMAAPRPPG